MSDPETVLPPCGHTDRDLQLTEIDVLNTMGNVVHFLVCGVAGCPEFCRAFIDLRDPRFEEDEVEALDPPAGRRDPSESAPYRTEPPRAKAITKRGK